MAIVYLVRHGETTWNRDGRFQGQLDADLSELGRAQAAQVAERLATVGLTGVVASDLRRATDTGLAVAARAGVTLEREPAFRELSFGAWQGYTRKEIEARFGDAFAAYLRDPDNARPEGGESFPQAIERVRAAADRHLAADRDGRVAWVMHGGSIRALLTSYLGWPPDRRGLYRLDNASVTLLELRPDTGFVSLHYLNDRSHLGGSADAPGTSQGGDAF